MTFSCPTSLRIGLFLGSALSLCSAACSSPSSTSGSGGTPGKGGATASGGTGTGGSGTGGAQVSGGAPGNGGTNTSGGAPAQGGVSTAGVAGTLSSGGAAGAGAGGSAGAPTMGGVGGTAQAGGSAGVAGAGGAAGGATSGGAGGAAGAAGAGGGGGGTSVGACPPDAFFCSGFEDAGLPTGATYSSNLTSVEMVIDKTVHHAGAQSVKVNLGSGYVYRMLSVPAAPKFWFRAYLRTDVAIGAAAQVHESFMGANWGMDKGVDIVQEQCEVAVNINDNPVLGSNGMNPPINCPADGQKISANTWYCFEGSFDGTQGNLEIFVDGKSIIKGTGVANAKQNFTNFRFGYVEYNGTNRTVWYDDVATGPNRIPCLP